MAGLIGDGGTITLSSTVNSTTPAIIADYRQGTNLSPPDGLPCSVYSVLNNDSSGASIVWVNYTGMPATKFAPVYYGSPYVFQKGFNCDEIQYIAAFGTSTAGVAASVPIAGMVVSRRK